MAPFAHKMVAWYNLHKRDLPWRSTTDPYRILVSETMLQQTRVETVIDYYHRFLATFPDIASLANADEAHVLKLWEGLGYYSRARNLHRAMKQVNDTMGGEIPDDTSMMASLPGVGPYTVGAVMSIAFNRPVAAVDGNVLRVMARYLGEQEPIDDARVKRHITAVMQRAIETSVPRQFTQAVMELGAMVCVPKRPQCLICPVADSCVALARGETDTLPIKRPKKARRKMTIVALWLEYDGRLVVEQRPDEGLLANMWQLPSFEWSTTSADDDEGIHLAARKRLESLVVGYTSSVEDAAQAMVRERTAPRDFVTLTTAKHVFTHLEWDVVVVRPIGYHQIEGLQLQANQRLVPLHELSSLAWPKVYITILREVAGQDVRLVES